MGAERLLEEADERLHRRDYAGSRSCAVLAMQLDPHIFGAEQVVAICDVFLALESNGPGSEATSPNWYSILKLEPFTEDDDLIVEQFNNLITLLSPSRNSYSHAYEAYKLVKEAFRVLSNEEKKMKFDEELREKCSEAVDEEEDKVEEMEEVKESFYTLCPYCFWIYEYERVYVDCCLRCQNCRRGFHGVEIQWPPPVDPGEDMKNSFVACMPFGVHVAADRKGGYLGYGTGSGVKWVEISDDDDDDKLKHKPVVGSGKGAAMIEFQPGGGVEGSAQGSENLVKLNGRGRRRKTVAQGSESVVKPNGRGRRRKTVAANSKKVTGRGIPRSWPENVQDSVDRKDDSAHDAITGSGELSSISRDAVYGGLELMDGDEDLMVCLEDL